MHSLLKVAPGGAEFAAGKNIQSNAAIANTKYGGRTLMILRLTLSSKICIKSRINFIHALDVVFILILRALIREGSSSGRDSQEQRRLAGSLG